MGLAAQFREFQPRLLQRFRSARADRNIGARSSKGQSNRTPDPAAPAGHDDPLPLKIDLPFLYHFTSPLTAWSSGSSPLTQFPRTRFAMLARQLWSRSPACCLLLVSDV